MNELQKLEKAKLKLPKGIKKFIFNETDFRNNKTLKISRYVCTIEEWHGKLLHRTFAFISSSAERKYKNIRLIEVQRKLEGYKKVVLYNCDSGMMGKRIYYNGDYYCKQFSWINDNSWWFNSYEMFDRKDLINRYNLRYCQYDNPLNRSYMDFFGYICLYRKEPKIELLVKLGYSQYISGLNYLDLSKKKLHEIFKIEEKYTSWIKSLDIDRLLVLRKYKKHINTIDDLNTIARFKREVKSRYIMKYFNFKMITYLEKIKTDIRIYNVSSYYADYLQFAEKLGLTMSNKVLFPSNLKKAHDTLEKQIDVINSKEKDEAILEQYKAHEKYIFDNDKLLIRPVKEGVELIEESKVLDHCVRQYIDRVARKETEILFIRKKDNLDKPYVTVELKGKQIIQVRGIGNNIKKPLEEDVKKFVNIWSRKFKLKGAAL